MLQLQIYMLMFIEDEEIKLPKVVFDDLSVM